MGRYFIKQLCYKMKYNSFGKMCTNLVNDIDHSITCSYPYAFLGMQEPFSLDKIPELDLNLLNQIPLLIGSLSWVERRLPMLIFFFYYCCYCSHS